MRVLVIGGSGYVASLVLPTLAQYHTLRIFDRKPPSDATLDYVEGDSSDLASLRGACAGMDALLYMAMGAGSWNDDAILGASFDANVKGVYLALRAAHENDITHAVYTSSMSVYDGNLLARYFPDEDIPPDASHFYGFTKRLGEECCRVACRQWGMTVNALRLCLPQPEEKWYAETRSGQPTIATTAGDVARALLAALDRRFGGFEAFMISGDYEQTSMRMSKARRLLDWEPLARPHE